MEKDKALKVLGTITTALVGTPKKNLKEEDISYSLQYDPRASMNIYIKENVYENIVIVAENGENTIIPFKDVMNALKKKEIV